MKLDCTKRDTSFGSTFVRLMLFFDNAILWKESLNRDVHQFHQYQQNEQSPLIWAELTEHNKVNDVGNPGPGLGQAQQYGGVKPVDGISTLLSW
jgi:hypothetical protein